MPRAKQTAAAPGEHDEHDEGEPAGASEQASEKGQMQSAPAPEKPTGQMQSAPTRFESDYGSLILYAGGKKIAVFSLGAYETDDPTVIAVLRGHELVREVGGDD